MKIFKHSGDLGDIIYSLPTIKMMGGGVLALDTSGGEDEEICRIQCMEKKTKFNKISFEFIKPLISAQPYIKECREYIPGEKIDINLNKFREKFSDPNSRSKSKNLLDLHLDAFNLPKWNPNDTWLTVDDPIHLDKKIVVTRTPRYQSSFAWFQTRKFQFAKDAVFIGLPKEHEYFEWTFDIKIEYRKVQDALEMARVISGSSAFVSNATLALSVAIGEGHRNILHELDTKVPTTYFEGRKGLNYV